MPPPSMSPALHLLVLPNPFFVIKLQPGQEIAPCVLRDLTAGSVFINGSSNQGATSRGSFFSITRTSEEVSIVGEAYQWMPESYREQATWMCLKIRGPMDHNLTGILASLSAPLKTAKVPVFALSTWNTDYVLVPTAMLTEAVTALERDGWVFVQGIPRRSRMARL